jgi:hypothetical protein
VELPSPAEQAAAIAEQLRKIRESMIRGGARALYMVGEIIITDAKANYVPVRDGILRASGFVREPVITHDNASVTIGFGGAAEAYALEQHERLDYHHTVGGPKYLERPVLAHAGEVREIIAREMRTEIGL